jgi:hypothetical protein
MAVSCAICGARFPSSPVINFTKLPDVYTLQIIRKVKACRVEFGAEISTGKHERSVLS